MQSGRTDRHWHAQCQHELGPIGKISSAAQRRRPSLPQALQRPALQARASLQLRVTLTAPGELRRFTPPPGVRVETAVYAGYARHCCAVVTKGDWGVAQEFLER